MKKLIPLLLAAALGACTASEIENGVLGSAKSWCRSSSSNCTVTDQ